MSFFYNNIFKASNLSRRYLSRISSHS